MASAPPPSNLIFTWVGSSSPRLMIMQGSVPFVKLEDVHNNLGDSWLIDLINRLIALVG